MNKKVAAAVIFCFLTGCASQGRVIDLQQVKQIQEGVSTEADVQRLLGAPYAKSLSSDGKIIMQYIHTVSKTKGSTFVPVVGLFKGGVNIRQETLSVLIGADGKVEKYTYNEGGDEIKTGLV